MSVYVVCFDEKNYELLLLISNPAFATLWFSLYLSINFYN